MNIEKSEISFGRNIATDKKEMLRLKLNFKAIDVHDRYLGLPTHIESSKNIVFQSIQDGAGITRRIISHGKGFKREILPKFLVSGSGDQTKYQLYLALDSYNKKSVKKRFEKNSGIWSNYKN